MGIKYYKETRTFHLDTANTSYLLAIVDGEGFLGHIYYGKRLRPQDALSLLRVDEPPFVPGVNARERASFLDSFPTEYSGNGVGDYRESCIAVRTAQGFSAVMPLFDSYEILDEKPALPGLPASFAGDEPVQTLVLHCVDKYLRLRVDLLYSVFAREDIITRSVQVHNDGEPLTLTKLMSACIDMEDADFEMLTLHGSWARERQIQRRALGYGRQGVSSGRGESSHQEHPFMAWLAPGTDQTRGEVYAMHFVYSGNFLAQIEKTQHDMIRAVLGIHPEDFAWYLETGESFISPEAVLTYSDEGLGKMTRSFHDFYRSHMMRSSYTHKKRPILINNWEATYFDFDTDKLLAIAKQAAASGIEMLVMDDGWFGHRQSDDSSLGDWYVNEEKLPGGLAYLVEQVNALGLKFGIWIEPEMISPDSKLYEAHSDWALAVPGRPAALSRCQYVLDFGRKDVRDYIYENISAVLRSANIEYVKWDMNRQLSDLGSFALPPERQGEICHRYVLGVYEMQERLVREFPHILLENCSGGGARFDPGMLYYSPQIWCSDDTDAIERLSIQEGTALVYPLSAMGAHVSACPNHTVGRITPFETRGHVALAGTFGYELDITALTKEELAMIPEQVAMYHKYNDLVRTGDYYRIASYHDNHTHDCYMVVSADRSEALVTFVQVMGEPNRRSRRIRLQGLDPMRDYRIEDSGRVCGGDLLMQAGLVVERPWGDFCSRLYHLCAV
ncbi:MAG: alpha-galactosidase [Muribaculaceae bacterium]|nr:alpha-galactosidase [Roseburia sp.]MCM1430150.1 alpha-galactosidase [Muribaculaceae bacterium]MCM1493081.1 alpha-galactosidase [Muribaculaceae bacterium]